MNYTVLDAARTEYAPRHTEIGMASRVKDNAILAFFSLAYQSAVILLRVRSKLIAR
jgi:hypothetical protein